MQITLVLPNGNNSKSIYSYHMERKWSLLCAMLYSLETICGCQLRDISAEKGEDLLLLDCHLPSTKVDFMFLMISCSQR